MWNLLGVIAFILYCILTAIIAYGDSMEGINNGKAFDVKWRMKIKQYYWVMVAVLGLVGIIIPLLFRLI